MPRVLHVSENIQGGIATSLTTLVGEHLKDPEWSDIQLVASSRHAQYLGKVPSELIRTYQQEARNLSGFRNMAREVVRAINDFKPDVVYLHSTFPGAIGRIAIRTTSTWSRQRRPAIVFNARGWSFHMERPPLVKSTFRLAERMLSRACDRIICISQDEYNGAIAAGISKDKCRLVYNGISEIPPAPEPIAIPVEILEAKAAGIPILLYIGRYDEQKGVDLLLKAMESVSHLPLRLLCAGGNVTGGPDLTFPANCVDLGWATPGQVTYLLSQCDALIVPSRWEGFGLVAVEAGRAGKGVLCSDRGGLPEIVIDGVTGVVIRDLSPSGIASVLARVGELNLTELGAASKQRFDDHFRAGRMFAETTNVYRDAMECSRS